MKKTIKLLTSFILSVLLVFIHPIPAIATTSHDAQIRTSFNEVFEDEFGILFKKIVNNSELLGISSYDYDTFVILNPITWNYTTATDSNVEMIQFPIQNSNGDVELIYSIMINETGYNSTLSRDFAPLIDYTYKNHSDTVLLVNDSSTLYVIDNNNITSFSNNAIDTALHFSGLPDTVTTFIYADTSKTYYTVGVNDYYTNLAINSLVPQNYAVPYGSSIEASRILGGYPIVSQGSYNLCWAASISSILIHTNSATAVLDITQISDYMGIGYNVGATIEECSTALNSLLDSSYSASIEGRVLSLSEIQAEINSNDPIFLKMYATSWINTGYHAIVLMGYDITYESTTVYFMDPLSTTYGVSTYNGSTLTYTYSGYTLTWVDTITIE